jgi:hypothetical protein
MKHLYTFVLGLSLSALMLFGNNPAFAEENSSTLSTEQDLKNNSIQPDDKHMPAGERGLSIAENLAIRERLAAEPLEGICAQDLDEHQQAVTWATARGLQACKQCEASISIVNTESLQACKKCDASISFANAENLQACKQCEAAAALTGNFKATYYVTTHPGAIHWPIALGLFGEKVELEDGSIWSVSSSDSYKTLNWLISDHLVITPNHDWFSIYAFRIHNQNTGISVAANLTLYLNPAFHSVYNHRVISYDDILKMIWLEDGSVWSVSSYDYSPKWQVGDTVFIGINDGWLSSSRPNILINANLLHYVRANCLN